MQKRVMLAVLCLALSGCTRVIDGAEPQRVPPAAPVSDLAFDDLLSEDVEEDLDGDLFAVVDPENCAGVAREVDPPFLEDLNPLASTGGHWITSDSVYIAEMVAVYPSDFDAAGALAKAKQAIEACVGTPTTVTSLSGGGYTFEVGAPTESENTLFWGLRHPQWSCDNTMVAAYNAAIEITTCASTPGYDVATLAAEALERIEKLANTTA